MPDFGCAQDWLSPSLDVFSILHEARWIPWQGGVTGAVSVPTDARTKKPKQEICVRERGGAAALTHSPIPVFSTVEHCSVRPSYDLGCDGVNHTSRLMLLIDIQESLRQRSVPSRRHGVLDFRLEQSANTPTRAAGRRLGRKRAVIKLKTACALEQASLSRVVYGQRGMNVILWPLLVFTD